MAPRLRRAKRPTKDQEAAATQAAIDPADDASPLRRSMSEATRRVDEIVAAAEKAAAEIRAEADHETPRPRGGRASRTAGKRPGKESGAGLAGAGGAPLRKSMSDAKRRVEEVIDAAERAAAEIRAEAEAEASRLIEARRAEAAEIRSAAERHLTERRKEAAEIRAKAETDAGRLLEKQRADAAKAQAEAEAEAGRYLAGRRAEADRLVKARQRAVSDLSQSLLGHAQGLRERAETLAGELEQTVAQIREVPDSSDVGEIKNATPPDVPPTQATNPTAESAPTRRKQPAGSSRAVPGEHAGTPRPEGRSPRTVPSRRRGGTEVPEEAVLRATQMAVEGNPREEIDRALRRKFGLTDTAPILDDILGRED